MQTEHTVLLVGNDEDVRTQIAFLDTEVVRVEDIEQAEAFLAAREHDRYLILLAPDVMRTVTSSVLPYWPFAAVVGETVGGVPGWLFTASIIAGARTLLELPAALPWLAESARKGWPTLAA